MILSTICQECFRSVEEVRDQDVQEMQIKIEEGIGLRSSSVSGTSVGSVFIITMMRSSSVLELIPIGSVHTVRGPVTALDVSDKISYFN